MKTIRVSGCHDCDKKYSRGKKEDYTFEWFCPILDIEITIYIVLKKLPYNCPLEEGNEAKYNELLYAEIKNILTNLGMKQRLDISERLKHQKNLHLWG